MVKSLGFPAQAFAKSTNTEISKILTKMFAIRTLSAILCALQLGVSAQLTSTTTPTLNITSIATLNQASVLQCWQLTTPFTVSTQAGTSGALNLFLGDLTNGSYTVVPSRFNGGLHNAPSMQFVVFLSGLAHVTLPNTTAGPLTEAWIQGGKYGTIFAADVKGQSTYGHITTYPSDADTILLQLPVAAMPEYRVLYQGPCQYPEMVGL